MLVRIKGKVFDDQIKFQIPSLFFENKSFVSLQHLIIHFTTSQKSLSGRLATTLIDRSPFNPEQVLANFHSTNTMNFYYQPSHPQYYKIQRLDLTSSEFILNFRENIKIKEIDEIEILLHIIDARVQQRPEQSIF